MPGAEINGRPLLDYWLDLLFDGGIERVLLNTHWLADKVERHVARRRAGRSRIDLVHEDELLGTGGTVLANRRLVCRRRPFCVAHADNLTDFDVARLDRGASQPAGRPC